MATTEYAPRRAKAGQTFRYMAAVTDGETGVTRLEEQTFRADSDGVVRPSNADEQRVLDRRGLAVARKVQKEERDETSADSAAASGGEE